MSWIYGMLFILIQISSKSSTRNQHAVLATPLHQGEMELYFEFSFFRQENFSAVVLSSTLVSRRSQQCVAYEKSKLPLRLVPPTDSMIQPSHRQLHVQHRLKLFFRVVLKVFSETVFTVLVWVSVCRRSGELSSLIYFISFSVRLALITFDVIFVSSQHKHSGTVWALNNFKSIFSRKLENERKAHDVSRVRCHTRESSA